MRGSIITIKAKCNEGLIGLNIYIVFSFTYFYLTNFHSRLKSFPGFIKLYRSSDKFLQSSIKLRYFYLIISSNIYCY